MQQRLKDQISLSSKTTTAHSTSIISWVRVVFINFLGSGFARLG
jgi:hypothetical protein